METTCKMITNKTINDHQVNKSVIISFNEGPTTTNKKVIFDSFLEQRKYIPSILLLIHINHQMGF